MKADADIADAVVVPEELLPKKRPVGRPRGQDKTGGRRRDMINLHELSPNATPRQLRTHVSRVCAAHQFEPISVLCRIGANKRTEDKLRVTCATEVAGFLYPKLRSIEMTGKDGESLNAGNVLDSMDKATLEALVFLLREQTTPKVVENVTDAVEVSETSTAVARLRPPGWRST
jgi:hypothetical protein